MSRRVSLRTIQSIGGKKAKYHFFSGFETGDLTQFDGTFEFIGDVAVLAAAKYSANYGLRARVFTTDFFGKAWVYKLLSPKLSFFTCECMFKLLNALNVDDIIYAPIDALTNEPTPPEVELALTGITRINAGYVWIIGDYDNVAGWRYITTATALLLDTWYKVKLEKKIDPTAGYTKVYVDDGLIYDSGLVANDGRGNIGSARVGTEHYNFKPPETMNVYVDDVTIDPPSLQSLRKRGLACVR